MSSKVKSNDNQELIDKRCAREKLLRSKFYRMMAFGCALAAFVVSGSIFENLGHHDSYYIIRNPLVIALLLLPFVPAAFLAILSKKRRQQAINLMKPYSQTISKAQWRELKEQE